MSPPHPAQVIADTRTNLIAAANGENMERNTLYAEAEKVAHEAGLEDSVVSFKTIAEVEQFREGRYLKLAANMANREVSRKQP
ncbi:MAG: hypothetical protein JXA58_06270 [Dehalococcoidia bacterium]|nr:hypothetical protein [Dehalococcoidia bacterium]